MIPMYLYNSFSYRCCSHGSRKIPQQRVVRTPHHHHEDKSSVGSHSRAGANANSANAGATVIITPDNESYGDERIWSHKYDSR